MKRTTHLVMGVAAAAPLAAFMPPVGAVGCLWLGMVGGGFPDYVDIRSGMKRHLRHRGISHSLAMLAASAGFVFLVLDALNREVTGLLHVPGSYVVAWTAAFGLGFLSHIIGDACTRGGVQPLLPLAQWKCWLTPRFLRGASSGRLNSFARLVSLVVIGASLGVFISLLRA